MHTRVVLQARVSSSRLPAKVLLPIAGIPLAVLCAKRIMRTGLDLVLATSDDNSDDVLVDVAEKYNLKVCRGSLDNVLRRFIDAVQDLSDEDIVVRVTADNPITDALFVETLIDTFKCADVDYLGTWSPVDALPYGLSAEIMTAGVLRRAHEAVNSSYEREHVTPWVRQNARARFVNGLDITEQKDLSYVRCTVDTLDDYITACSVFKVSGIDPVDTPWPLLISELCKLSSIPEYHVPFKVRSGSVESVIALGTVQLGLDYGVANKTGMPAAENANQIIRHAINYGVTWIDTARGYGVSERRVGNALSSGWSSRTRIVTKLSPLSGLDDSSSALCVRNAVGDSLFESMHALKLNKLDVLLLHRWSHRTIHNGNIWQALLEYKNKGLIQELGASIYTPEEAIVALHDKDVTHLQLPFNLIDQRWLRNDFQQALANRPDVRIHVRSIFLQGLLINDADIWPAWLDDAGQWVDAIKDIQQQLTFSSRVELCMAYVLAQNWIDSIVVGVETLQQLEDNLKLACVTPLSKDQCQLVERLLADAPERLLNPSQW